MTKKTIDPDIPKSHAIIGKGLGTGEDWGQANYALHRAKRIGDKKDWGQANYALHRVHDSGCWIRFQPTRLRFPAHEFCPLVASSFFALSAEKRIIDLSLLLVDLSLLLCVRRKTHN